MSAQPAPTAAKVARPFIIWTVQRTGGTNLAQRLFEVSGLPGTQGTKLETNTCLDTIASQWDLHEPFNYGKKPRPFGFAAQAWAEQGDRALLQETAELACSHHVPIKHCVEMVPWPVSEALVRASLKHGYRHLFLYRRNPLNRLLSMEFARRSGVWGPNLKGSAQDDEIVFAEHLPVAKLMAHEKHSSLRLEQAWTLLAEGGARLFPLAFEDVYLCPDPLLVKRRIWRLLNLLELPAKPADVEQFTASIVGDGDQGTRDKYARFNGIPDLEAALASTPLFARDDGARRLHVRATTNRPAWILNASVDTQPAASWPDIGVTFGGLVVLAPDAPEGCSLRLAGHGQPEAKWDIASPMMAKQFPAARNCNNARFLFERAPFSDDAPLVLQLVSPAGTVDLFQLTPVKPDA